MGVEVRMVLRPRENGQADTQSFTSGTQSFQRLCSALGQVTAIGRSARVAQWQLGGRAPESDLGPRTARLPVAARHARRSGGKKRGAKWSGDDCQVRKRLDKAADLLERRERDSQELCPGAAPRGAGGPGGCGSAEG